MTRPICAGMGRHFWNIRSKREKDLESQILWFPDTGEYGVIFRWLQIDMNKRGRWEEWNPVCDRLKTGVVWYLAWMYR